MPTAAVILAVLALAGAGQAESPDPGFDLFVFVRSYSPTFCQTEPCGRRPITAFTIHGLWPNYRNGLWPEFCEAGPGSSSSEGAAGTKMAAAGMPSQQLWQQKPPEGGGAAAEEEGEGGWEGSIAQGSAVVRAQMKGDVGAALRGLEKKRRKKKGKKKRHDGDAPTPAPAPTGPPHPQPVPQPSPGPAPGPQPQPEPDDDTTEQQRCEWPSFAGTDASFWDHEWDKHGTCARAVTGDRAAFFNATMRLHEAYNLDVALAAAGIIPSDQTSYATRRLESAIEDAFSVPPLLSCFHGQLLEVWLCVGLDLRVRQCPPGVLKAHILTCGSTISLPEGSPVPADCRPYFPPWKAPPDGTGHLVFVRILTGLVAAAAGAAAVALFFRAVTNARRPTLDEALRPEQPYDALQSWCPPRPRSLK